MTAKFSPVIKGFAALALSAASMAYATPTVTPECNTCGHTPNTPANGAEANGTGIGTGTGIGKGTGIGVGGGGGGANVDTDINNKAIAGSKSGAVAGSDADAKAINGDLTSNQVLKGGDQNSNQVLKGGDQNSNQVLKGGDQNSNQVLKGGDQNAVLKNGDQTTNVDASNKSQTNIDARETKPVEVAAAHRAFLIPPQVMGQCVEFSAKEKPSWGIGVQWDYNKSIGLQWAGGSKSDVKTDEKCLKTVHQHLSRMQNLAYQHEISLQTMRDNVEIAKLTASMGIPGQMVVLQRYFSQEAETVSDPNSAVARLFNLGKGTGAKGVVRNQGGKSSRPGNADKASSLSINAKGAAADALATKLGKCENGSCAVTPAARGAASAPAR